MSGRTVGATQRSHTEAGTMGATGLLARPAAEAPPTPRDAAGGASALAAPTDPPVPGPAPGAGADSTPTEAWVPPTWDDVVRTHSARVYRLAYRLTGNQHDAEDLTQE